MFSQVLQHNLAVCVAAERSHPVSDQILQAAEKKNAAASPASTAPASSPASTSVRSMNSSIRPNFPPLQQVNSAPGPRSAGAGIASTAVAQTYRQNSLPRRGTPPLPVNGSYRGQTPPMRPSSSPGPQSGYDPRSVRPPPPGSQIRNGVLSRAPPAGTGGRRF